MRFILLIILLILISFPSYSTDIRLKSMGEITYSVPDIEAQINLYQVAGNIACLKANDSTSWMYYSANSFNNWGSLKRHWDAEENQFHNISFSGLKHLGKNQVFYGYINYNWDFRNDVNNAIEKNPYGYDPFVLADYTIGNFLYHGPEIFAAYNLAITKYLYWGVSLKYYINQGLKNFNTKPEIISREINASIDFVYRFSTSYSIGLSFKPYQTLDITKLVTLEDGLTPITRRYRGEFFYREKVSKDDRSAQYEGYIIKPQFAIKFGSIESIMYFDYFYQWHKLFDKPTKHLFDGYFQAQHYKFHTTNRLLLSQKYNSFFLFEYSFEKIDDWAKEPQDGLLIFQAIGNSHKLVVGGSSQILDYPLLAAFEVHLDLKNPQQIDYLVNKDRKGSITDLQIRSGIEYSLKRDFDIRIGYIYHKYIEDEIWNYFGDYNGSRITFGSGWRFNHFEFDTMGEIGLMKGNTHSKRSRTIFNIILQLKQYF